MILSNSQTISRRFVTAICFALSLCAVTSAAAQQGKTACPTPPPSKFKHTGEIVTRFDSKQKSMVTILQHPLALANGAEQFYLYATFTHTNGGRPLQLSLAFISIANVQNGQGSNSGTVKFSVDGQRQPFTLPTSYSKARNEMSQTIEARRFQFSFPQLLQVTESRRVAVNIDNQTFTLTENHLEALRDIASRMSPSPDSWSDPRRSPNGQWSVGSDRRR